MSICITLLAACGGGDAPNTAQTLATVVANPLGGSPTSVASDEVASSLPRMKALGVVLTTPNPTADQLLNWAEINYPQYFPSHSTTLSEGPWVYRSYMQTGVLLGINAGEVYVTGGQFGGQLLKVGRIEDFVKPPIAVKRSSYENKMMAGEMTGPIEKPWPAVKMHPNEEITAGIALADFFQDGTLSVVAFSNTFDNPYGPASLAGKAYFFKRVNGAWVDRTSEMLKDQTGCISPRKVFVADFNGDKKPDVFASCTGYDDFVNGKLPGEHPRFLLSQPDGTYQNVAFQFNCYCHGSAAADVRGDGYADIVAQDNAVEGVVYFKNNKDGTFTMERDRIPESARRFGLYGEWTRGIWTVELADIRGTGKYDLFLGGVDKIDCPGCSWGWRSKVYWNNGSDSWSDAARIELPSPVTDATDVYDAIFLNGYVYEHRDGPLNAAKQNSMGMRKVNIATLESTLLYEHHGFFDNGYTTGTEWIIYHNGKIKNFYVYPDIAVNP